MRGISNAADKSSVLYGACYLSHLLRWVEVVEVDDSLYDFDAGPSLADVQRRGE